MYSFINSKGRTIVVLEDGTRLRTAPAWLRKLLRKSFPMLFILTTGLVLK